MVTATKRGIYVDFMAGNSNRHRTIGRAVSRTVWRQSAPIFLETLKGEEHE